MPRARACADPFRAIADPSRRRMLDALLQGERSVGELTSMLGVSQPTVSEHLRILRDAGLVTDRADGRHRLYSAVPAALRPVHDWTAQYEAFWSKRLDGLAAHLARRRN